MNNHELLTIIGEVSEDYVLAADDNVVRPRFRWGTLAACAACAALIVAAYPVWQAARSEKRATADSVPTLEDAPEASQAPVQRPGLHEYTLAGDGKCAITTEGSAKAPEGGAAVAGQGAPVPEPAQPPTGDGPAAASGAYEGGDAGTEDIDGFQYSAPSPDAAVDEAAANQYDGLLRGMGLSGEGPQDAYPDWYGGAWIDHGGGSAAPAWLTVAIVDGFRTRSLEQQILGWCGGTAEVLFADVKYSQNYLNNLMEKIDRVFEELDCHIFSSYGVYPDNRVHLDFFEMPGDEVLAALAEIDPDNSAIYIQVFTGVSSVPTDGSAKGPAPAEPAMEGE